jgi:hypothetical protein
MPHSVRITSDRQPNWWLTATVCNTEQLECVQSPNWFYVSDCHSVCFVAAVNCFAGTLFCQKITLIQFSQTFQNDYWSKQSIWKNKGWLDRIQGSYYQMKNAGEGAVYASLCMSLLWVKQQNCLPPSQTVSDCLSSHEGILEPMTHTWQLWQAPWWGRFA